MRSRFFLPSVMAALWISTAACERDGIVGSPEHADASRSPAVFGSLGPRTLTPGRPTRISQPEAVRPRSVRGLEEADRYVSAFDYALTRRGADYLAAAALGTLAGEDGLEAEVRLAELRRSYNSVAQGLKSSYTIGFEGAGECDVDFDDSEILDGFPNAAESTFVVEPFWVQECGDGDVRIEPTAYDHYHLLYEDSSIDCFDDEGHYGRGEPGDCVALDDPALEPRYLGSMGGDEVVRIRLVSGGASQPFTLHSFANVGNESLRFSYRKGGVWYMWPSLGGNVIWDVSNWVTGVTEVKITSTLNSDSCGIDWEAAFPGGCVPNPSSFFVDDFSISP